jgi:hypothetical protein
MSVGKPSNKQAHVDYKAYANIEMFELEEQEGGNNVITFDDHAINKQVCIYNLFVQ